MMATLELHSTEPITGKTKLTNHKTAVIEIVPINKTGHFKNRLKMSVCLSELLKQLRNCVVGVATSNRRSTLITVNKSLD